MEPTHSFAARRRDHGPLDPHRAASDSTRVAGRGGSRVPGKHHVWSPVTRSTALRASRPLALTAAFVLTATVAGVVAYEATGKTATLTVDGKSREVDFRGKTVGDLLAAAGVTAGGRDTLVPSASTVLADGDEVALRRARQFELVVDGKQRNVWVTAASVDEALTQVGLGGRGLALSASRSRRIPLGGLSLDVRTPKTVKIVADGATRARTTTVPTVRDALIEAGVHLDGDDRLSQPRTLAPTNGLVVKVTRVAHAAVASGGSRSGARRASRRTPTWSRARPRSSRRAARRAARQTVRSVYADGALEKRIVVSTTSVRQPVKRSRRGRHQAPPRASRRSAPARAAAAAGPELACPGALRVRRQPARGQQQRQIPRPVPVLARQTWRGVGGSGDPADAAPASRPTAPSCSTTAAVAASGPSAAACSARRPERGPGRQARVTGLLTAAGRPGARHRAAPAPHQDARPELRHRPQHRAAPRAHRRCRGRRRRGRGRPGARLPDPRPARGRPPASSRSRSTRVLAAAAAGHGRRSGSRACRPPRGGAAGRADADRRARSAADRVRREPALQRGRPGAAAAARAPAVAAHRPGDGAGRGRRPARRAAGQQDVRRPVGRRPPGTPRSAGPARIGRNVFWPAPNVDSGLVALHAAASRRPATGSRRSRSSTRRSRSGARPCGQRSRVGPARRRRRAAAAGGRHRPGSARRGARRRGLRPPGERPP